MGVSRLRAVLAVAALLPTLACGRIGYDEAPPITQVEIRALDGTTMLQGGSVRVEVTILPRGAASFGRPVTITASPGRLNGARRIAVSAGDDGGPIELTLTAGMDVRDGRVLIVESDAPETTGDIRYVVESAPMVTVDIGPATYAVADSLVLDAPLPPMPALTGRTAALLMGSEDSGFGTGPLVLAGDPFEVFDGSGGTLVPVPTSGVVPASGRIAQAMMTSDATEYGERVLLCVAGATGGLYSIAPDGAVSLVRPGGCNGVVRYGTFVYIHTVEDGILRLLPDGTTTVMISATEGLPAPAEGFFLAICPSELFPEKMVLFSAGGAGVGDDGFSMAFEPWDEPRPWAEALAEPLAATYDGGLPFGTVMLVALYGGGELVALRDDGSQEVVVGGLTQPTSVAAGSDGTVWLLDQGADRLLRLSRAE